MNFRVTVLPVGLWKWSAEVNDLLQVNPSTAFLSLIHLGQHVFTQELLVKTAILCQASPNHDLKVLKDSINRVQQGCVNVFKILDF